MGHGIMTHREKLQWICERAVNFGDPRNVLSLAHIQLGMSRLEYWELIDGEDFKEMFRRALQAETYIPVIARARKEAGFRASRGDLQAATYLERLPYEPRSEVKVEERREVDPVGRLTAVVRSVVMGRELLELPDRDGEVIDVEASHD